MHKIPQLLLSRLKEPAWKQKWQSQQTQTIQMTISPQLPGISLNHRPPRCPHRSAPGTQARHVGQLEGPGPSLGLRRLLKILVYAKSRKMSCDASSWNVNGSSREVAVLMFTILSNVHLDCSWILKWHASRQPLLYILMSYYWTLHSPPQISQPPPPRTWL